MNKEFEEKARKAHERLHELSAIYMPYVESKRISYERVYTDEPVEMGDEEVIVKYKEGTPQEVIDAYEEAARLWKSGYLLKR